METCNKCVQIRGYNARNDDSAMPTRHVRQNKVPAVHTPETNGLASHTETTKDGVACCKPALGHGPLVSFEASKPCHPFFSGHSHEAFQGQANHLTEAGAAGRLLRQ